MPTISDVAEAIKSELADGQFSLPFKAIRAYRHDQALPEGKEIRIAVVPKGVVMSPAAKTVCRHEIEFFVVITKKVDKPTPEVIDPLLGLVEEIIDFFRLRRLAKLPEAAWMATEIKPLVSSEHLDNEKQFTSLLTLKFLIIR